MQTLLMPPHASSRRDRSVSLLEAGYSTGTSKRYREAVLKFAAWWDQSSLVRDDCWESFDLSLGRYLQYLWSSGAGKSLAACTLNGIIMYLPHAKGKLLISARMVRNWGRAEPAVAYPPLSWPLTVALAVRMASSGRLSHAVATLLAFVGLLRVGELCSLSRDDVAFVGDPRIGSAQKNLVLRLRTTKTGAEQSVVVDEPDVVRLLRDYASREASSGTRLFPFGPDGFRRVFKDTCTSLGLSQQYVPHSLRHGGATALYLRGLSVETVMERGRWASSKSARRYIQSGRSLLLKMKVPAMVQQAGEIASKNLYGSVLLALSQCHFTV